jgi:hypothetical protein
MSLVSEMKSEIEYRNFKYFVLESEDQLNHHVKPAFEAFLQAARSPEDWKVSAGKNRDISIKGTILIWGDATEVGKEQVEKNRSFHKVLTIAEMCDDLRSWKCDKFERLLADRQRWCHEMFSGLRCG